MPQRLAPRWTKETYGRSKVLENTGTVRVSLVEVNPLGDTSIGKECKRGLASHPGQRRQRVTVLEGEILHVADRHRELHKKGDSYLTVRPNGDGYWHKHVNPSKTKTATLLVAVVTEEPFPADIIRS